MKTLKKLFQEILTGDKETSRLSAREVRKVIFSPHSKDKIKTIRSIIDKAPTTYKKIKDDWRQENFVMSVSIVYFMHDNMKSPEPLYPWIFELMHHKNGHIRYAAFRMIKNDLGPLTAHVRNPDQKFDMTLEPDRADNILLSLYINLNNSLVLLNKPSYKKYKYVDLLPAGPYKTIEMTIAEMKDLCGKEYMKQVRSWVKDAVRIT